MYTLSDVEWFTVATQIQNPQAIKLKGDHMLFISQTEIVYL